MDMPTGKILSVRDPQPIANVQPPVPADKGWVSVHQRPYANTCFPGDTVPRVSRNNLIPIACRPGRVWNPQPIANVQPPVPADKGGVGIHQRPYANARFSRDPVPRIPRNNAIPISSRRWWPCQSYRGQSQRHHNSKHQSYHQFQFSCTHRFHLLFLNKTPSSPSDKGQK